MTTILYSHAACLEHLNLPGHPERPDRLRAIDRVLGSDGFEPLVRIEAPEADPKLFELAHPRSHVDLIHDAVPLEGFARVDADTAISPKSWEAVLRATGAAVAGVDAVFSGEADNVFASVRPPGHHAEKATAMGFCLINSVAVAARHAQRHHDAERVAIVDFDVHHGNGTQDIFYEDETVLFASSHQMPLFPGTGELGETGAGNIFNAPLSDGDGGEVFKAAWRERILPAVDRFGPDLIIISAGFDAHRLDPLAGINLEAEDFDWVTGELMDLASRHCGNRIVSVLEGGYDLTGLATSVAAHVNRLMTG
ncbi:MAG: histone deacetylase family protein [Nitratireductor sp.]|nr:histone deacetylase family protein [Nitratireductor sp.]